MAISFQTQQVGVEPHIRKHRDDHIHRKEVPTQPAVEVEVQASHQPRVAERCPRSNATAISIWKQWWGKWTATKRWLYAATSTTISTTKVGLQT